MTAIASSRAWGGRGRVEAGAWARRAAILLAVAALAGTAVLRFYISRGQPLWLDETWTAAIAAQDSLAGVWRQAWLDVNAPLYYGLMHLWQVAFGPSDAALRIPSAIFGAAAALAALIPIPGLSRTARFTWAALIALWIPGLYLSGEARCYTLLLLLCTLQTVLFVRLLQAPNTRRASAWCAVGALAILTHYHAGILGALQGLAYLAVARRKAVRTWPAALVFLLPAAWIAYHAPRIAAFADPAVAWYPKLSAARLERVAWYLAGSKEMLWALGGVAVVALLAGFLTRSRPERPLPTGGAWIAAATAVVGIAVVVGLGFLRPSYTDRYLVAFMPGLLLGVVLVAQALGRRWAATYALVILAALVVAAPWAERQARHGWRWYNWQVASQDLMRGNPQRLVFVWDHPASPILARDQLDMIGGFFFERAGKPVEVRSLAFRAGQDPNPAILAAAAPERSAIIWAYDRGVRGTAARVHPPLIEAYDPRMRCKDYGRGSVSVVACDRFGSVEGAR